MLYNPSTEKNFELYNDLALVERRIQKGWCHHDYTEGEARCLEGAIMDVEMDGRRRGRVRQALRMVLPKWADGYLVGFNDDHRTTKKKVLALIDRAMVNALVSNEQV
jgi:hypothetical protein